MDIILQKVIEKDYVGFKNLVLPVLKQLYEEKKLQLGDKFTKQLRDRQNLKEKTSKLSPLQKQYQDFFKSKLKEYGVKSPQELEDKEQKKFFNEVKKEWANKKKDE